jgi:hypothetical protein
MWELVRGIRDDRPAGLDVDVTREALHTPPPRARRHSF